MLTTAIIGLLAGIALASTLGILSARHTARTEGTPKGRHRALDSATSPRPNRNNSDNVEPTDNPAMKMAAEGDRKTQPSFSSPGR